MQIAVVILALVVVGAIVGGATVLGAPVFAVPFVAALLAGWALWTFARRALGRERPAREPVEFSDEDRATMLPSPSEEERQRNRREAARRL